MPYEKYNNFPQIKEVTARGLVSYGKNGEASYIDIDFSRSRLYHAKIFGVVEKVFPEGSP